MEKQGREECSGLCPSQAKNTFIMNNGLLIKSSSCLCCQPAEVYNQTITMECLNNYETNNWTQELVTYVRIKTCNCKACTEN